MQLARVGVDRRRLLAYRELHAVPVEDRAAAGRDRHGLLVLELRLASERRSLHALDPDRAREGRGKDENEDREQQADAPVCLLVAHYFLARLTYPYSVGSW